MKQYIVKRGENIFDISMTLSGTIEGIWDLLICNDWLTIDTKLEIGMVLNYHEDFVVNDSVVKWISQNNCHVKNGYCKDGNDEMSHFIVNSIIEMYGFKDEIEEKRQEVMETSTNNMGSSDALRPFVIVDRDDRLADKGYMKITQRDYNNLNRGTADIKYSQEELIYVAHQYAEISAIDDGTTPIKFWNDICQPKMVIDQYGVYCGFRVFFNAHGFIAVDWGDGSDYEAFWQTDEIVYVEHDYNDAGRHKVHLYGMANIMDLDFNNLNGVYYALAPVYYTGSFTSKLLSDATLNQLLIRKIS